MDTYHPPNDAHSKHNINILDETSNIRQTKRAIYDQEIHVNVLNALKFLLNNKLFAGSIDIILSSAMILDIIDSKLNSTEMITMISLND